MYSNFITFLYEPFYVGKGKKLQNLTHLKEKISKLTNRHKYYTIQKIRKENLEPIIFKVIDNIDEKCAFCFEKFLISSIGRSDLNQGSLTNMTDGGEGSSGLIFSDVVRKKMRESHLGQKGFWTGKNRSEETKIKCRNSQLNKIITEEEIRKNREWQLKNSPVKNTIWIHNINQRKRIKIEELNFYIQNGWIKGLPNQSDETKRKNSISKMNNFYTKNTIWIHKFKQRKRIKINELSIYIKDGWLKGRNLI
jgi:hypothetical protein